MILNQETPFWRTTEKGASIIIQSKLIEFLSQQGYCRLKIDEHVSVLVKKEGDFIKETNESEIAQFVSNFIKKKKDYSALEVFIKGIGHYITSKKLNLLNVVKLINDKDDENSSRFYFNNTIVNVTKDLIEEHSYESLKQTIWKDRLLKGDFKQVADVTEGQFYKFCRNISANDESKFISLQSIIGYVLHRNRARGEDIAIIFYDEKMGSGRAEGGTGKTLLTQAISKVREVVTINGKDYNPNTNFKNQRINLSTDVIVYDDLSSKINLETFFSQITSGIEVEQKRKDSYYIQKEDLPKYIFTSNYYIKGPGGSSDMRRRVEFMLSDYYSAEFTPEQEFGNRFFTHWKIDEWNQFYNFLIHCVQVYLNNGIIPYSFETLQNKLLDAKVGKDFNEFANSFIVKGLEYDKRELEGYYSELYPNSNLSPHMFYKYCKIWCLEKGIKVITKSSGGMYTIKFI